MDYPYFNLAVWLDENGDQRIKWTTSRVVTPFLNLRDAKLMYFEDLHRASLLPDKSSGPKRGVAVVQSPNTGDRNTVFWKALRPDPTPTPQGSLSSHLIGESLTIDPGPLSLESAILSGDMQFAVIDEDGLVLFHSDPARGLQENFIQECEDDLTLRSIIFGRRGDFLTTSYRGRPHRLFVGR